jgi:hypothetical protein
MTPDEKHKAAVRAEVERRGLTSVMNDTKWRELRQAVRAELPFRPPYQRKDVLEGAPAPATFDADVDYHGDWVEGLEPLRSVEWIRVRPRYLKPRGLLVAPETVDCADAFRAILRRCNIPFVERDDSFWVYGYTSAD